jgi:hypothetical protein
VPRLAAGDRTASKPSRKRYGVSVRFSPRLMVIGEHLLGDQVRAHDGPAKERLGTRRVAVVAQ